MEFTNNTNDCIQNVILISFDSLRSDYIERISPVGAPTFCRMRDEGAFFRNVIVQAPFTIPSHASMLSGLYPAKTGVHDMNHRVPPEVPTIFSILKERGFHTIGSSPTPLLTASRAGFQGIDHHVSFRCRKLKRTLIGLNGKRFFTFLHYWAIHTPYETWLPGFRPLDVALNVLGASRELENIRFARRFGDMLWLLRIKRIRTLLKEGNERIIPAIQKGYEKALIKADRFLAKILNLLKQSGLAEKTLVVVTGDHGDSFNEHGEIDRAVDGRYEHGQFLYDNVLRVPLIFFCEGRRLSRVFDSQIQEVDIVPTLLEALGVDYQGGMDGRSLWRESIMKGVSPEETFTFSEVVRDSLGIELRCVRSSAYKLIHDYKRNAYELYDLKADSGETSNLYTANESDEKAILLDALQRFSECQSTRQATYTEDEQQAIEKTLRDLGYMD